MKILSCTFDTLYLRLLVVENGVVKLKECLSIDGREPELIASLLKNKLKKVFFDTIITSIDGKKCFYRNLSFPFSTRAKIEEALPFQIEALPIDPDNSIQSTLISKKGVDLFSVGEIDLEKTLNLFARLKLDPEWVGSQLRALQLFGMQKGCNLVLHVADESTTILYLEDKQIKKSFFVPIGAKHLSSSIEEDKCCDIDEESIKNLKMSLDRYIEYLKEECHPSDLSIAFSGYAASNDFFQDIIPTEREFFGVELGNILDVESKTPVQFRVRNHTPKKQITQLKRGITRLALVAFVALLATFLTSITLQKSRVMSLERGLKGMLCQADLHRYSDRIQVHSIDQFQEALDDIDDELSKKKYFFDVTKRPPRVHAILAQCNKLLGNITSIESFHYTLLSYPTIEKPKASFEVMLEFGVKDEASASRLIEQLKKMQYKESNVIRRDDEIFAQVKLS